MAFFFLELNFYLTGVRELNGLAIAISFFTVLTCFVVLSFLAASNSFPLFRWKFHLFAIGCGLCLAIIMNTTVFLDRETEWKEVTLFYGESLNLKTVFLGNMNNTIFFLFVQFVKKWRFRHRQLVSIRDRLYEVQWTGR